MKEKQNEIIDTEIVEKIARRRKLLPLWIKVFIWMFLIIGAIAPLGLIFGLTGSSFQLSLYGIETIEPMSLSGFGLTGVFLFKGITAFGLWTEKDWAIIFGQIDAILGILICVFVMFVMPFIGDSNEFVFSIRLELVLLVPFLIKLRKISNDWSKISVSSHHVA